MKMSLAESFSQKINGYLFAFGGTVIVSAMLIAVREQVSHSTVALALLLVVLFAATGWGSRPALAAAMLGGICFNFFFLPPFYTLRIDEPENWIALSAFLITALTVGELSSRGKQRAEEAEAGRREIEKLYREYQEASEQAKQAEILRQSERLKSALLDAVTHDLRTPLTSIKASVTTLLAEMNGEEPVALDEESRREFLVVINEEADRLNHFVENMVELARIEAGATGLRRRWSSIEDVVALARERALSLTHSHRIEIDLERELPTVRVDANSLAEVLYSLIDNATKYSPPGSRIRVTARLIESQGVLIAVEDEGQGIPVELRERVFDKFFRATDEGAASLKRPKGLGMGLAIARGIIEAHGGLIWIEGGPNVRGTRVVMMIPIGDEEADVRC